MKFKSIRKKVALTAAAALCGLALSFPALPAPNAEASILGVLISSGIQYAQLDKAISYYNNDEKGRQEFFKQIQSKYGVNNDAALNSRLDSIMSSLSSAIATVDPSIQKKPYNYFINNETSFNAFCTLGHNMSVNTGLFNFLNSDDEIAVVLGHEMGHGQKDHPAKGIRKSIPIDVIAQVFADSQGTYAGALGATIFANYATALQVTKPQEWEADNLSFDYITHSNYNPGACAAIWQRVMEKQKESSQSFVGEIFSPNDHPTNEQRRDNYAKKLAEFSQEKVSVKDGMVKVNGKDFIKPAPAAGMSSAERSYFVAGNLAAVYHNNAKKAVPTATVANGILMMGNQPIISPQGSDPSADELAARLNTIK